MPKYSERQAGDLAEFIGYVISLSPHDLERLFEGLFSPPELRMILTRFAIAKELRKGKTYKKKELPDVTSRIANTWWQD